MKKIFTLMAVAVMALAVNAQTFNGEININVNGSDTPAQDATILVEKEESAENLYDITLKDFNFSGSIQLGDIKIGDVNGTTDENEIVTLSKDGVSNISTKLGPVEVTLNNGCKIEGDKLFMDMSIKALGGAIIVKATFEGTSTSTGIGNVTVTDNGVEAIYDLNGRKLNEMQKGINIVRKADGTTVKVLKK